MVIIVKKNISMFFFCVIMKKEKNKGGKYMIPDVKCEKFGEFYFTTIFPVKNELFLQLRDDGRTIQGNLRNFGWIEITPITFTNIYVNITKDVYNKQTYLFMLESREEFMKLLYDLIEDPTTPLPTALDFKPAIPVPDVPSFRRQRTKSERKKEKKFKSDLFQIEKKLSEEEKKQEEKTIFYGQEVEEKPAEPVVPEINEEEDLF